MPTEISLYTQYQNIVKQVKQQHEKSIVLFRVGDFFEIFFEDAITVSKDIGLALTSKSQWQGEKVPMCGVPVSTLDHYIGKLLSLNYVIAIADQVESAADAKKRKASLIKREVVRIYTKGTLIEEDFLQSKKNSYLCSLSNISQDILSIAWTDVSTQDFFVKKIHLDTLEYHLGSILPVEIILTKNTYKRIESILKSFDADITPLSDAKVDIENLTHIIKKYYNIPNPTIINLNNPSNIIAVGCIIDYITLTYQLDSQNKPLPNPKILDQETHMNIDQNTLKQLEIIQSLNRNNYYGTLLWAIDKTLTSVGGRLFYHHLITPITNKQKLESRQETITYFIQHSKIKDNIRTLLKSFPDLERNITKLISYKPTIHELKNIATAIDTSLNIKLQLDQAQLKIPLPKLLQHYSKHLGILHDTSKIILNALTDTLPKKMEDGGFFRYKFDATLDEFRRNQKSIEQDILQLEHKYKIQTQQNIKLKFNNLLGYFIETTKNPLRDPQFIHRQSTVSVHRYTTKELNDIAVKLIQAQQKVLIREQELFHEFRDIFIQHKKDLKMTSLAVALIDWATSGAELAITHNYCCPKFYNHGNKLSIKAGRHPSIEMVHQENHLPYEPNDCSMDEKHHTFVITGPNMAGKSTYLRQVALIAWVAHTGYYVPAQACELSIIEHLKTRIGASDDLAKGMSTFMLEMIDVASILHQANPKSLIILDEVGRGTSTFDGMAIAQASLEYLHTHNRCKTLFATHYLELASMKNSHPDMLFFTMDIQENNGNINFTHQLIQGQSHNSYGIFVAEMAGLPKVVTKKAKQLQQDWETSLQHHKSVSQFSLPFKKKLDVPLKNPLHDALVTLDLDSMTPKKALEMLYKWKRKFYKN